MGVEQQTWEENGGLTHVLLHSTCYQVKGNLTSQDKQVRGKQISMASNTVWCRPDFRSHTDNLHTTEIL